MNSGSLEYSNLEDFVEQAYVAGWTDGLPVYPPESETVRDALATVIVDPAMVLWTGDGNDLSVNDVAVASVLAGCEPSYFPVVLAAAQAYLDGLGDNTSNAETIADESQCVVVNGPIRNQLDINCGLGLYGPGWRANATIGRALRFVVRATIGTSTPSFGDPGQYTLCFGEDEENSDWTPLHAQRGFAAEDSAVTVLSTIVRGVCHDRHSNTPEELLDSVVVYARGRLSGAGWFGDDPCSLLLIFAEESKRVLGSWPKEAVHSYLYKRLVADDGTPLHPVQIPSPQDLLIVAAGGPAFSVTQLMLAHRFSPVTKQVYGSSA